MVDALDVQGFSKYLARHGERVEIPASVTTRLCQGEGQLATSCQKLDPASSLMDVFIVLSRSFLNPPLFIKGPQHSILK